MSCPDTKIILPKEEPFVMSEREIQSPSNIASVVNAGNVAENSVKKHDSLMETDKKNSQECLDGQIRQDIVKAELEVGVGNELDVSDLNCLDNRVPQNDIIDDITSISKPKLERLHNDKNILTKTAINKPNSDQDLSISTNVHDLNHSNCMGSENGNVKISEPLHKQKECIKEIVEVVKDNIMTAMGSDDDSDEKTQAVDKSKEGKLLNDNFDSTDESIKSDSNLDLNIDTNVADLNTSVIMNSDNTIKKINQLNKHNEEELPNENLILTNKLVNKSNFNQNLNIITNINTIKTVVISPEPSSAISETLLQDMSILNITEKNNKNNSSSVILNKQTDSLRNLMLYDSSDNESEDSDFEKNWQLHMLNNPDSIESSEDSESDSNESLESSDASSTIDIEIVSMEPKKTLSVKSSEGNSQRIKEQSALYSLAELDKFNLPPLPDLNNLQIDYENEEFLHIGHVKAIVETLITIEAIQGSPFYDLDTIFFIDDQTSKKPLGAVYDVIGPVVAPIYCIRMKNDEELQERGVKLNMNVYSAPKSKYTQYVFVAELRKLKGTDASWLDDREMPQGVDDSSGDELESEPEPQTLKRKRDSLERHKRFEKTMNRCNSLHTRVAKLMDHHKVSRRGVPFRQSPIITNVASDPEAIPQFNPSVPPPNFVDLSTAPPPMFGVFSPQHPHLQIDSPRPAGPTPHLWQEMDFHPPRFHRQQNFGNQNQSHNFNHNWSHHPGPSRGRGHY